MIPRYSCSNMIWTLARVTAAAPPLDRVLNHDGQAADNPSRVAMRARWTTRLGHRSLSRWPRVRADDGTHAPLNNLGRPAHSVGRTHTRWSWQRDAHTQGEHDGPGQVGAPSGCRGRTTPSSQEGRKRSLHPSRRRMAAAAPVHPIGVRTWHDLHLRSATQSDASLKGV